MGGQQSGAARDGPCRNLLIPGIATLWTAWEKIHSPLPPAPLPFSLAALGALAVNLSSALLLVRFRNHSGSLTRAAFLSSRNDVLANLAMIATAVVTVYTRTGWPDLVVGLGIAALNMDAAHEVWTAARKEGAAAER
jgi:Co/Zn/Cd efflux system component